MLKNKKTLFWGANIVFPLVAGLIIYILYKPEAYICRFIHSILGTSQNPDIILQKNCIINFVRFHLSDMCWSYALTSALSLILTLNRKSVAIAVSINTIFSITLEILQLNKVISGTFDVTDILLQILSGFMSAGIILYFGGYKK